MEVNFSEKNFKVNFGGKSERFKLGFSETIGIKGDSAYEIAVKSGFTGTQEEWLQSLVGPPGIALTNYTQLEKKPQINGVELNGNLSTKDLLIGIEWGTF